MNNLTPRHVLIYDGAVLNIFHANKGEGLAMHAHMYSHAIVCNSGSCLVSLENGKSLVMKKDTQPVDLLANIKHEIKALEDETVFVNVFAEGKY